MINYEFQQSVKVSKNYKYYQHNLNITIFQSGSNNLDA